MIPELSPEQRAAGVARAAELAKQRAQLRCWVRTGQMPVTEALRLPETAQLRVAEVLAWEWGIGAVKAERMLEVLRISGKRRCGGLRDGQARRLFALLNERERFRG